MTTTISGDTGVSQVQNNIVSPAKLTQPLTLGTAQNTTSGTSIDFTGIPAWVKRITVMFNGVSTNGTAQPRIQIGAGSVETSGYLGSTTSLTSGVGSISPTAGFDIYSNTAAAVLHGSLTLTLLGSNVWLCSGVFSQSNTPATITVAGSKTTSSTLDRIRITTSNGTDTFDAGSVNILYEG